MDISFLFNLFHDYKKYPIFIESGTYHGETIFNMEPHFEKLYTVEISEQLYFNTKMKYNGKKICFLLGDSLFVFKHLLPNITDKLIFYLDGNYSSGDTGRGKIDVPLYGELLQINNLYKHEGIIIIDDVRLFETKGNEDWSYINKDKIFEILRTRITKVYHLDTERAVEDRLIIHISALDKV